MVWGARRTSMRSPGCRSDQGLHVEMHAGAVVDPAHRRERELEHGVVRQHDGTMRQHLGSDGHKQHGVEAGMEDGPVGRQRVGRRPGGRGHDEPVGPLRVHRGAVDVQAHLDHPVAPRAVEHHVLQRRGAEHDFVAAHHAAGQQHAIIGLVAAAPPQQGAVAADHDGQVDPLAERLLGRGVETRGAGVASHVRLDQHRAAGLAEHGLQAGSLVSADQGDGWKMHGQRRISSHCPIVGGTSARRTR